MVGWEPYLFNWAAPPNNVIKGITETVIVSEQRARVTTHIRPLEESVLSSASPVRKRGLIKPLTEDSNPTGLSFTLLSFTEQSFTITPETIVRLKTAIRLASETTLLGESATRTKSGTKAIGIEVAEPTVQVSDSVLHLSTKIRRLTAEISYMDLSFTDLSFQLIHPNAIVVSDSVTFVKPVGLAKTITETVTISEQIDRLETKVRTAIETESVTDSILPALAKIREIIDDVPESSDVVDIEVIPEAAGHTRSLIEDETIAEDILQQTEKVRTIDETEVITDRLQGWAKGIPMQAEAVIPDITNIIGAREFYVRPQAPRPPRFEYAIENTVYAPLRILPFSHDINKVIEWIRPIVVPLSTLQSGLRVGEADRPLIRVPLRLTPQPNTLRSRLRIKHHSTHQTTLTSDLRLSQTVAQVAIEPRRIINIERKYRTLKAYLLLHMIESLD